MIQPVQNVPTVGVFQSSDLTRNTPQVKITDFSGNPVGFGHNDLQPVVLSMYPVMQDVHKWLVKAGCHARMTGSGACFFTESTDPDEAQLVRQKILNELHKEVTAVAGGSQQVPIQAIFACSGLTEHPLRHWLES